MGTECSYLHSSSTQESDILNYIKQIKDDLVKNVLKNKEMEIYNLKDKVEQLENEGIIGKTEQETRLERDICDYTSNSERTLKSHHTKKQKKALLRRVEAHKE